MSEVAVNNSATKPGFLAQSKHWLKQHLVPKYKLSTAELAEANAAVQIAMLQAVIDLQVKTVYGLKYEGVAFIYQEQATTLSKKAESTDISKQQRAVYLHMSKGLLDMAEHLKFQGIKSAGK